MKNENDENRPSGAKAQHLFCGFSGTTEVVPFQNIACTIGWPQAGEL
jgi:hypothetical protein